MNYAFSHANTDKTPARQPRAVDPHRFWHRDVRLEARLVNLLARATHFKGLFRFKFMGREPLEFAGDMMAGLCENSPRFEIEG